METNNKGKNSSSNIDSNDPCPPMIVSYPIGSICSSVLEYSRFLEVNGDKQKDFDINKSIWAPCDGRSVKGSRYNGNVPDLRGVFLRGINNMGINGAPPVNNKQLNPESKFANEFQEDEFKSHNHNQKIQWDLKYNGNTCYLGGHPIGDFVQDLAVENNGGKETRPKNVTVYYYIRIN